MNRQTPVVEAVPSTPLRPSVAWRISRWTELLAMFVLGPTLYVLLFNQPGWLFPALWGFGATCLALLLADRSFDKRQLWNLRGFIGHWRLIALRFAILAPLLGITVALADELLIHDFRLLFSLPRERPVLWAFIMVGYPIASVYPQEVIWRTFFFHRYDLLLPRRWMLLFSSAITFAYAHLMFPSPYIAITLTLLGGLMFAHTYERTRSTLAACIEHALYGCFIFTIGIGRFFYSGNVG